VPPWTAVKARRLAALLAVAAVGAGVATAQLSTEDGRIGPDNRIQPSGRELHPVGKMTRLGNFPTGGALTTNGRFLWTISSGRGPNDIRIVEVFPKVRCRRGHTRRARARYRRCARRRARRVGRVVQTIPLPGANGGIAMARDNRTAYVSGTPESPRKDQQSPTGTPGKDGDVIHVFTYDGVKGTAKRDGVIEVPPPSDAPAYQDFPPQTSKRSWPRDLAVTRDGATLVAALNLADRAAIVDTRSRKVDYVEVGHYPYGAAVSRDGKRGFVTSETEGTVSVIDLAQRKVVKELQVGPRLSHPEGMATDPKLDRIYVAIANQDLVAVIDTDKLEVERTLSVERPQGIGTGPVALNVTRDGCDLLVANSGEDSVAVFALSASSKCDRRTSRKQRSRSRRRARSASPARARRRQASPFALVGRLPVGSYPTAVDSTPHRKKLVWVSARGLGVGPNPRGPDPNSPKDSDDEINSFQYLPSFVRGGSGILNFPNDRQVRKLTRRVSRQIVPTNTEDPPAGTPIKPPGTGQKIEHVFWIVKENRTYDQVLGDDSRGDGDPKLTLFGEKVTPNLHALAKRFPLLDHVYANSEASIDGHYWTAAGAVSDYVVKNWHQNYAGRKRPYDFGSYVVSAPPKGYLFQRAEKEDVSYFNYGEALAGLSPLPDKDRSDEETQLAAKILTHSDIGIPQPGATCYDSDISNSSVLGQGQIEVYDSSLPPGAKPGSRSRFDCFRTRFNSQVATGDVPAFNYLVLPNNHTEGTRAGRRTPTAQIATNDYGLGQIVDLISHSSIWDKSLILVAEDDSQDGADHVDAHRIPALAISPYAKKGAVVHTRYDQISFLRTLEIIVGLKPLNLAEALAVPLYDALGSTPSNDDPYTAIKPSVSLTARNSASTANARLSSSLPLNTPDRVPQPVLDKILWQYVHGIKSRPPPPGPNASGRDEAGEEDR
jgi:DNA-binding beta-propeller fold protein YncE